MIEVDSVVNVGTMCRPSESVYALVGSVVVQLETRVSGVRVSVVRMEEPEWCFVQVRVLEFESTKA